MGDARTDPKNAVELFTSQETAGPSIQKVARAWIAYVRFKNRPVGHVFIVFRYTNGEEAAISPEAEFKNGGFSLLKGFFKTYRLAYFIREPRALIREYEDLGRRVIESELELSHDELNVLHRRMRARAAELEERAEWYHPIHNSCVNNVMRHLDEIHKRRRLLPDVFLIFRPSALSRLAQASERKAEAEIPRSV